MLQSPSDNNKKKQILLAKPHHKGKILTKYCTNWDIA